jgi:thioester reductase-like protein
LLTGDTVTGRAAPADFLSMFFRGVAELGCVPERAGAALRVDVTPVDYAARAMAHLSLSAENGLSTFHIASPRGATVSELVQAMRAVGAVVDEVTEDEWAARLRGLSDDPSAEQPASECASAAYLALCRCLSGRAFERHRTMDLFQATDTEF